MDDVSAAVKTIDRNRYTVVALLCGAALFGLASCGMLEGRASSTVTGQRSTAAEIHRAAELQLASIQRNARDRVAEIDGRLAALRSERERLVDDVGQEIDRLVEIANEEQAAAVEDGERRAALLDFALNNPAVSPYVAAFGGAGLLAALGVGADNRRKDAKIRELKAA